MAPARRMTRSNREVYPIMFLSIHQIHHLQIPLNLYTLTLFINLGYIVSINFILITRMQDSESSYSYESQRSEEQQFIDQNDTDQGTAEFVNRQDLDTFPYNAIGAVAFKRYQNQPRLYNGTGFLVSPNLVLTVAHNIINNNLLTEYIDLQFYHMLHGQLKDPIKVIDWKFPQEYKKIYFKDKKSLKYDYALLKLQRDIIIGKYFKLSEKLTNDREQISIIGYQGFMRDGKVQTGRQIEYRGQTQISIIKIDPKQMEIRHTLPSKSGQSGSPIITEQHEVVSIHKGGVKNKPYNIGVLVNKDMINNLRKWQMQMNSKQTIQVTQYLKQRSLEHSRLLIRTASQREKLIPTKIIEENRYQKFPYCCIGQIVIQYLGDKQKNGVNTAFLISNNLVLTSFNSIFNPQIQNFNSNNPKIKVFFIPTSQTSKRQKIPIQSFRINPESLNLSIQKFSRKTKNQDLLEDIYYDYCLLKLSKNIQTKHFEYLQLAVNYTHTQKKYSVYGYPSRNHQGKQIQNPKIEGNISRELDTYIDRHMIAHNIDTKFGMIGSPIIVDYNKVVGIHKLKLLKYNMCKGGRLITTDLIDKLYEWNQQLQGSPFSVHYYNQQDYVPVSNSKQLLQQHKYFKSKLRESRRRQLRSSRSNI